MSRGSHRFMPEQTNGGAYFSDCSCGWSGGVYPSRGDAKHAHAAHVTGGPVPEPIRPTLLLGELDSDNLFNTKEKR